MNQVSGIIHASVVNGACLHVISGGTRVTVYGSNLNSVAEPRITLTVITARFFNDTDSTQQVKTVEEHWNFQSVCL